MLPTYAIIALNAGIGYTKQLRSVANFAINEVMGTTIINQHCYLFNFFISLHPKSLRSSNAMHGKRWLEWSLRGLTLNIILVLYLLPLRSL